MTELAQSHGKTSMAEELLFTNEQRNSSRWTHWRRCCEYCWNDNKGFIILLKEKGALRRFLQFLRKLRTEKMLLNNTYIFHERRVNLYSKLLLMSSLRNWHSHPNLWHPPTMSESVAISSLAKTFHHQKDYNSAEGSDDG